MNELHLVLLRNEWGVPKEIKRDNTTIVNMPLCLKIELWKKNKILSLLSYD
jgi:hypothetical protein